MQLVRGAVAGVAGAMAMSVARSVTTRLGLVGKTPPEAIASEAVPRLLALLPAPARPAAIEVGHWCYGGLCGALYGALPGGLRRAPGAGPAYGAAVWLFYEAIVAPGLGLSHAHRLRPVERAALLADHLLYGAVVNAATGGSRSP